MDQANGATTVNFMKGSWNLALAVENAALADANTEQALNTAFQSIPEFAAAHAVLFPPPTPHAQTSFYVVLSDSTNLFAVPLDHPERELQLTSTNRMPCRSFDHPACVGSQWLYFDAMDYTPGEKLRRGLWRMSLADRSVVERMTSDPWGNSYDACPVPSAAQPGVLYRSNRTGMSRLQYAPQGSQGPGYGYFGGAGSVAVWSTRTNEMYQAYVPPAGASTNCSRIVYDPFSGSASVQSNLNWTANGALSLTCTRIDMAPNGQFLLVSATDGVYLKPFTNDAYRIIPAPASQASFSPDSRHVAFVQVPAGETSTEIYVAALDAAGLVTNTTRLTHNGRPDNWPTWAALDASSDADGDGLSAAQEFEAGSSAMMPDTDADGMTDGAEVTAGTIPVDATSVFVVHLDRDPDGLSLTWNPGLADRSYTVQAATAMTAGFTNWVSGLSSNQCRLPADASQIGFFRVLVAVR